MASISCTDRDYDYLEFTVSGLQYIQTYNRRFVWELYDSSTLVDRKTTTVGAGSTASSTSCGFSGLSSNTTYTVNVSAYNSSESPMILLDSWAMSASTTSPPAPTGNIYIYTGAGGWKLAEAYIYTGSSGGWKKAAGYIYDGSDWRN